MLNLINPEFPVGNAAGWCKSVAEVENLARSAVSFIVVGSITVLPRSGNPGNTFNNDLFCALNSLGLPNPGIDELQEIGPEMVRIAHEAGKPIIMSIAGFSPEEFGMLAGWAERIDFDGVELNLGCPNVADDGKRKPIISYRAELVRDSVVAALYAVASECFVSVKVSPMDPDRMDEIASAIKDLPIDAVVTQNTEPNCLDFDYNGNPVITTPDKTGYAGGSGSSILHKALGQVRQWRERLPEKIAVWGVGGAQTGMDVQKMFWAGASVVQVGTAYMILGPKVFSDIATQLTDMED